MKSYSGSENVKGIISAVLMLFREKTEGPPDINSVICHSLYKVFLLFLESDECR